MIAVDEEDRDEIHFLSDAGFGTLITYLIFAIASMAFVKTKNTR